MGFSKFSHVKISAIAGVVPEKVINIDDEIEFYNNNPKLLERNKKILGLGTRHVLPEGFTSDDLCEDVAKKILTETNTNKDDIDYLIVATNTPDYYFPSSSHRLHGKLDLLENCTCFDLNGGCAAGGHALLMAHSLIESRTAKKILLIMGDLASQQSNIKNRNDVMLFGDCATAVILDYCEKETPAYFYTGSNGKLWDKIVMPGGAYKLPVKEDIVNYKVIDESHNEWYLWNNLMEGMDVFKFTMTVGPDSIKSILDYSNKTINDIDFVAFHQANKQIVETIYKRAEIPKEKTSTDTFKKYGNCSTSSALTSILDNLYNKQVNDVMVVSFGIGLSWASYIINLKNTYNIGISLFKPTSTPLSRQEQIEYWTKKFKKEF